MEGEQRVSPGCPPVSMAPSKAFALKPNEKKYSSSYTKRTRSFIIESRCRKDVLFSVVHLHLLSVQISQFLSVSFENSCGKLGVSRLDLMKFVGCVCTVNKFQYSICEMPCVTRVNIQCVYIHPILNFFYCYRKVKTHSYRIETDSFYTKP